MSRVILLMNFLTGVMHKKLPFLFASTQRPNPYLEESFRSLTMKSSLSFRGTILWGSKIHHLEKVDYNSFFLQQTSILSSDALRALACSWNRSNYRSIKTIYESCMIWFAYRFIRSIEDSAGAPAQVPNQFEIPLVESEEDPAKSSGNTSGKSLTIDTKLLSAPFQTAFHLRWSPVIPSLITTIIVVQFRAVSFKVALSSALKATIALLIIVVVVVTVVVVVVVVTVVVVVSRPPGPRFLPLILLAFDCFLGKVIILSFPFCLTCCPVMGIELASVVVVLYMGHSTIFHFLKTTHVSPTTPSVPLTSKGLHFSFRRKLCQYFASCSAVVGSDCSWKCYSTSSFITTLEVSQTSTLITGVSSLIPSSSRIPTLPGHVANLLAIPALYSTLPIVVTFPLSLCSSNSVMHASVDGDRGDGQQDPPQGPPYPLPDRSQQCNLVIGLLVRHQQIEADPVLVPLSPHQKLNGISMAQN
ncbi:hypothetical protein Tco_0496693 [Tanacetum coccineum]